MLNFNVLERFIYAIYEVGENFLLKYAKQTINHLYTLATLECTHANAHPMVHWAGAYVSKGKFNFPPI